MEKVIDGGCTNSDFELNVKKKSVRFKAGAELSSSVNKMDVDLVEDLTDTHEILGISMQGLINDLSFCMKLNNCKYSFSIKICQYYWCGKGAPRDFYTCTI